jgi:hypothetical protein
MRDLLKVLGVTLVALGVLVAVVVFGGDTTVTVPPPEAVAEEFARQVATRRYDRALAYVDRHAGITLTTVRLAGEALHRRAERSTRWKVSRARSATPRRPHVPC